MCWCWAIGNLPREVRVSRLQYSSLWGRVSRALARRLAPTTSSTRAGPQSLGHAESAQDEGERVRGLFDAPQQRFAHAMPGACLNPNQDRISPGIGVLHRGCEFEAMRRENPIVVIAGHDQSRRIVYAGLHILHW